MNAANAILAYADTGDSSNANLLMVLVALGVLAATGILTLILIAAAKSRQHRRASLITTAAVYWAILTAASVLYVGAKQMRWSKEYTLQLQSGYLDPRDTTGKPRQPWELWIGLAATYVALLAWAYSQKPTRPTQIATPEDQ